MYTFFFYCAFLSRMIRTLIIDKSTPFQSSVLFPQNNFSRLAPLLRHCIIFLMHIIIRQVTFFDIATGRFRATSSTNLRNNF